MEQKAITDDALLSDCITDQLWAGVLVADEPGVGKGVVCTKVFERGALLCDYIGLLLEGDKASPYSDTSYLFKFKCWEKLCMVDSLDSDLYGHSRGRSFRMSLSRRRWLPARQPSCCMRRGTSVSHLP